MTASERRAIQDLIDLRTKESTVSREVARRALIEEGIYTTDGRLTPEYGGEK